MLKIMSVVGTRPELIRLSRIIPKLDKVCEHVFVYTDQNFDPKLRDIFFEELKIRKPNYNLAALGVFAVQIGTMFFNLEQILKDERPDKVLILGDTNSALCSIVCERHGIPVYHMEAGNRCGDKIAEEINRKIVDNTSTINLPYTYRSRDNLIREGFDLKRVFVTGNPIVEVLEHYKLSIKHSNILNRLDLHPNQYVLATLHRSENVDTLERLCSIIEAYSKINDSGVQVIIPVHPRTKSKLQDVANIRGIKLIEPLGLFDFVKLEQNAKVIMTDSGTCQEEAAIFQVPCVVTRRATERPELIECGAGILGGVETRSICEAYMQTKEACSKWELPAEYKDLNVSNKVINILQGAINI